MLVAEFCAELLMQKRCDQKILFPNHWANTCCSHPLHDGALFLGEPIHGEMDGAAGTVQAARRKLLQELGVDPVQLPPECFQFVTRVHYKAAMPGPNPLCALLSCVFRRGLSTFSFVFCVAL